MNFFETGFDPDTTNKQLRDCATRVCQMCEAGKCTHDCVAWAT